MGVLEIIKNKRGHYKIQKEIKRIKEEQKDIRGTVVNDDEFATMDRKALSELGIYKDYGVNEWFTDGQWLVRYENEDNKRFYILTENKQEYRDDGDSTIVSFKLLDENLKEQEPILSSIRFDAQDEEYTYYHGTIRCTGIKHNYAPKEYEAVKKSFSTKEFRKLHPLCQNALVTIYEDYQQKEDERLKNKEAEKKRQLEEIKEKNRQAQIAKKKSDQKMDALMSDLKKNRIRE